MNEREAKIATPEKERERQDEKKTTQNIVYGHIAQKQSSGPF